MKTNFVMQTLKAHMGYIGSDTSQVYVKERVKLHPLARVTFYMDPDKQEVNLNSECLS